MKIKVYFSLGIYCRYLLTYDRESDTNIMLFQCGVPIYNPYSYIEMYE